MKVRVAIIVSLFLLFAKVSFAAPTTRGEAGRYQIYFSPIARADVYLLDTETGRVWTNVKYTDVQGQPTVWMYQERIDSEAGFVLWLKQQKFIKEK